MYQIGHLTSRDVLRREIMASESDRPMSCLIGTGSLLTCISKKFFSDNFDTNKYAHRKRYKPIELINTSLSDVYAFPVRSNVVLCNFNCIPHSGADPENNLEGKSLGSFGGGLGLISLCMKVRRLTGVL